MSQYFPTNKANDFKELNRKVNKRELRIIENYIYELGLSNGYIQSIGKNEEKYVPNFDLEF
jgi:putative pyruvate formate lyase activating enzyme